MDTKLMYGRPSLAHHGSVGLNAGFETILNLGAIERELDEVERAVA